MHHPSTAKQLPLLLSNLNTFLNLLNLEKLCFLFRQSCTMRGTWTMGWHYRDHSTKRAALQGSSAVLSSCSTASSGAASSDFQVCMLHLPVSYCGIIIKRKMEITGLNNNQSINQSKLHCFWRLPDGDTRGCKNTCDPIEICAKIAFTLDPCKHFPAEFMASATHFGSHRLNNQVYFVNLGHIFFLHAHWLKT